MFLYFVAIEEQTKRRIFDHAPDAHTGSSQQYHHNHQHNSSSSSSTGPRYKSFDAGPRSKSFERDYMSAETGATWERSASFSVAPGASGGSAYAVPAAAPSILQSIYTWWGAAPLPTPALLSEKEENSGKAARDAIPASAAVPAVSSPTVSVTGPVSSATLEATGAITAGQLSAHSSTASIASTQDTAENMSSNKSASSSVPASPARAPVNKIAERLQKIRVQKQPPS